MEVRFADGACFPDVLTSSRQIAMSLEDGWAWVDGDEWRIDFLGRWSQAGVDEGQSWKGIRRV